jgi:phosphohistidine phosphatase
MSLHDIDRPLNKRGKKAAPLMGDRLAQRSLLPDLVICSPARRALATARRLAKQLGYPKKNIVIEDDMYGASPESMLTLVRKLDNRSRMVMLVGHNPETTEFANLLGGLDLYNVPTCGIVALSFDITTWKDVGRKKGALDFFDFPRQVDTRETD